MSSDDDEKSDFLWKGSPILENIETEEKWIEVEEDIFLRILIFAAVLEIRWRRSQQPVGSKTTQGDINTR